MSAAADWRDQRIATLEADRLEWKRLHDNVAVQLEVATRALDLRRALLEDAEERIKSLCRTAREQECQLRDLASRYERDVGELRAQLAAPNREAVDVCYRMIADIRRLDDSEFGEHAVSTLRSVAARIDAEYAKAVDKSESAKEGA